MLFNIKRFSQIYYFLFLLIFLTGAGTTGYAIIEDWGFIDSLYMTTITISTVGFKEVQELSDTGKIFTTILIVSSFGTFAYALSSITKYLFDGEYKKYFKEYRITKKLSKMENHVIVCGFGRVGRQVAEDLKARGDYFIIIECNEEVIEEYSIEKNYEFLKGDSTHDGVLERANVKSAKAIIICLPKDAENLYAVLSARELNPDIIIVSRASSLSAVRKLKLAGANNVIMPDSIGGSHMASLIAFPDAIEFMDIIRTQGNIGSNIQSIAYEELPVNFRDKPIGSLEDSNLSGTTIIGFKGLDGEYAINPNRDIVLTKNTKIFVIGNTEQIMELQNQFGIKH